MKRIELCYECGHACKLEDGDYVRTKFVCNDCQEIDHDFNRKEHDEATHREPTPYEIEEIANEEYHEARNKRNK